MRRIFAPALLVGLLFGSSVALVGCGEEEKTKTTTEVKGPEGSTKETVEVKKEVKGDGGTTPATPDAAKTETPATTPPAEAPKTNP